MIHLLGVDSVRVRYEAIAARRMRRYLRSMTWTCGAGLVGLIAGLIFAIAGLPALAIGTATVAVAAELLGWTWLLTADGRAALELMIDHDLYVGRMWRQRRGDKMPRTAKAVRAWLDAHPGDPDRAGLLLRLGRLAEVDEAIAAATPDTPEEAFALDILRARRVLLGGERPDTGPLHAAWPALRKRAERRHQRECLALLDAEIAAAAGEDALPIFVAARRQATLISSSSRVWRLGLNWLWVNLMLVVMPVIVVAAIRF